MYKILIRTLLIITLPIMTTLAMEEQNDVSDLLKILKIKNPTDLFYEALPYIKKYNEEEIKNLEIEPELKSYALKLKSDINNKFFDRNIESTKQFKTLLNFGANPNAKSKTGYTALAIASRQGRYKFVKLLLERRADPNISQKGFYPLIVVASELLMDSILKRSGKETQLIKIAQILIENKANVNAKDLDGNTALSFAAGALSDDLVQLLLEHKADPNTENRIYKDTPLMIAAEKKITTENQQNQINIVKMLIEHGAKLFSTNARGQTAYDLAQAEGNAEVANILKDAMQKRGKEIYGLQKDFKRIN